MTISPIGSLTAGQQKADAVSPTPEQQKAARDFEAIFLRQLLSSLEKGSGVSGGQSSGGAVFRSMMVSAMADKAAEGGGIGLSEMILKAMLPGAHEPKLALSPHVGAMPGPSHAGARTPGADPLDRLASALSSMGSDAATDRHDTTPTGAFPRGALDAASLPGGSARLGVASPVSTEARPARTLAPVAGGGHEPALRPGGRTR